MTLTTVDLPALTVMHRDSGGVASGDVGDTFGLTELSTPDTSSFITMGYRDTIWVLNEGDVQVPTWAPIPEELAPYAGDGSTDARMVIITRTPTQVAWVPPYEHGAFGTSPSEPDNIPFIDVQTGSSFTERVLETSSPEWGEYVSKFTVPLPSEYSLANSHGRLENMWPNGMGVGPSIDVAYLALRVTWDTPEPVEEPVPEITGLAGPTTTKFFPPRRAI